MPELLQFRRQCSEGVAYCKITADTAGGGQGKNKRTSGQQTSDSLPSSDFNHCNFCSGGATASTKRNAIARNGGVKSAPQKARCGLKHPF